MNVLQNLLKSQSVESFNWTNKLIETLTEDKWFVSPGVIESNIAWQIGHLTLSQYYYAIVLLNGPGKALAESINIKKYSGCFAKGQKINELSSAIITAEELKNNWSLVQQQTIEVLSKLQDNDFNDEIFKLPKPHPFVKTKEHSISWNIKHTMWHCGQIAMIKRVVDESFDFGM